MTRKVLTTLFLFAGAATSVLAQPQPPAAPEPVERPVERPAARTLKGNPDQPLGQSGGPRGEKTTSSLTMIQGDGENSTKVTIVDGEVTSAERNGKPISKDRIRQRDGTVEFLDDKGNVEHTMRLNIGFAGPNGARAGGGGARNWNPPRAGGQNNPFVVEGRSGGRGGAIFRPEPPKVMLGVTMTNADEATLKRLGVEKQEGVFIDSVIDNLPAAKGGLLSNDLVVEADGKAPLTEETLRDMLREKKPGDEIKLRVFRKGEPQDIAVKLEAYEADKLGRSFPEGNIVIEAMKDWDREFPEGFSGMKLDQDQVKEAIEQALKHLKEESKDFDKIKVQAIDELNKVLFMIDAHKNEFKGLADAFRERMGDAAPRIRIFNDRAALAPAAPRAPAADHQLDRLAEQLERLNNRLDDLEKRLSEKK